MKTPSLAVVGIGALVLAFTNASAAPGGGAAKTTVAPVAVVDATGKTVGRFGYPDMVFVNHNAVLFAAPLGNRDPSYASGLDFSQRPLYYTTSNCTGTAYIAVQAFGVRTAVVAMVGGLGGQTVAFISSGDLPAQTSWLSSINWNGTSYACTSQVTPQEQVLSPTTGVDVTGVFVAPFFIQ